MSEVGADLDQVHDFWFGEIGPDRWWVRSAATDRAITDGFGEVWQRLRGRAAADFLGSPRDAVAAVVLFDQFPRNLFRGQADAFATDPLAYAISDGALERGYEKQLSEGERSFLYMPLMHSEDLADQDRAVALFERLGWEEPAKYAHKHREMIARYGRFPGRNAALGREDRPDEAEGIAASRDW